MTVTVDIPGYDGGWMEVFWEAGARFRAEISEDGIQIYGNAEAFTCFAKQMLYFCFNDMPLGAHVHYDDFFCKTNCLGLEFVIGLLEDEDSELWYSGEFTGEIAIEVPESADGVVWDKGAAVAAGCNGGQVSLEGNRAALYALARRLLGFASHGKAGAVCPVGRYSHQLKGWTGKPLEFRWLADG